MSLLTSLPETGSLFLMGTFLILSGLVLRRVFHLVGSGISSVSKGSPQTVPSSMDGKEALSQPVSPQL